MTEPVQPPESTRFLLHYPDGTEANIYYSEPRTLDFVADQIWDKDSPATTVCGISCMCDRADPADPCKHWAGHDGDCTTLAPPNPTPLRTGGVWCRQHGPNSQCGVLCAMRYRR